MQSINLLDKSKGKKQFNNTTTNYFNDKQINYKLIFQINNSLKNKLILSESFKSENNLW